MPPHAVAQAAPDLTGVPDGAKVDPPGCLPAPRNYGPDDTAMVVGTDNADRTTISVEVAASAEPLADLRDHLADCSIVDTVHRGAAARVETTRTDDPAAPVEGAETLAFTRTVASGSSGPDGTRYMTSRVAQLGDVRILVTYMAFGSGDVDAAALDEVFRAAVAYAAEH